MTYFKGKHYSWPFSDYEITTNEVSKIMEKWIKSIWFKGNDLIIWKKDSEFYIFDSNNIYSESVIKDDLENSWDKWEIYKEVAIYN